MVENEEEKKKKKGGFLSSLLVALIALLLGTSVFFGWKLRNSEDQVVIKEKDNQDKIDRINLEFKLI